MRQATLVLWWYLPIAWIWLVENYHAITLLVCNCILNKWCFSPILKCTIFFRKSLCAKRYVINFKKITTLNFPRVTWPYKGHREHPPPCSMLVLSTEFLVRFRQVPASHARNKQENSALTSRRLYLGAYSRPALIWDPGANTGPYRPHECSPGERCPGASFRTKKSSKMLQSRNFQLDESTRQRQMNGYKWSSKSIYWVLHKIHIGCFHLKHRML